MQTVSEFGLICMMWPFSVPLEILQQSKFTKFIQIICTNLPSMEIVWIFCSEMLRLEMTYSSVQSVQYFP